MARCQFVRILIGAGESRLRSGSRLLHARRHHRGTIAPPTTSRMFDRPLAGAAYVGGERSQIRSVTDRVFGDMAQLFQPTSSIWKRGVHAVVVPRA